MGLGGVGKGCRGLCPLPPGNADLQRPRVSLGENQALSVPSQMDTGSLSCWPRGLPWSPCGAAQHGKGQGLSPSTSHCVGLCLRLQTLPRLVTPLCRPPRTFPAMVSGAPCRTNPKPCPGQHWTGGVHLWRAQAGGAPGISTFILLVSGSAELCWAITVPPGVPGMKCLGT